MALSDYKYWNEDAQHMWWQEEGRHIEEPEYDDFPDMEDDNYDDEDPDDDDQPGPFDDEPHIPEDAHLEAAYEDRFGAEDIMENDY